jgi:hypothetical protein
LQAGIRPGIHPLIVATIGGGRRLGLFAGTAFAGFLGEGKRREFVAAKMQAVGQPGDGQQVQRQQQEDYELFHDGAMLYFFTKVYGCRARTCT